MFPRNLHQRPDAFPSAVVPLLPLANVRGPTHSGTELWPGTIGKNLASARRAFTLERLEKQVSSSCLGIPLSFTRSCSSSARVSARLKGWWIGFRLAIPKEYYLVSVHVPPSHFAVPLTVMFIAWPSWFEAT
jgi:hypothetical protein